MYTTFKRNGGIIFMDKKAVIKIVENYANEIKKDFSPKKIYLYGSFAKGHATEDSDIDVALVYDEFNKDYLNSLTELYRIRRNFDTRIEPVILESKYDPTGFLQHVINTGIEIM